MLVALLYFAAVLVPPERDKPWGYPQPGSLLILLSS
jgi:hypothetical protein